MLEIILSILRGKTLMRTLMNQAARSQHARGIVLDIGGGERQSYFQYLQLDSGAIVHNIDLKITVEGALHLNLETQAFPYADGSVDTVLLFNVLEHIYRYQHLIREVARVLRYDGCVIGFVPFLINYHPDPHDYFRYTHEALRQIFIDAGFASVDIRPIGWGPFSVHFNNVLPIIPRIVAASLIPWCYIVDRLYRIFRPHIVDRYPLGYFFVLHK